MRSPDCCDVLTGKSGSLLDQPNEFIDSLNDADAILNLLLMLSFSCVQGRTVLRSSRLDVPAVLEVG